MCITKKIITADGNHIILPKPSVNVSLVSVVGELGGATIKVGFDDGFNGVVNDPDSDLTINSAKVIMHGNTRSVFLTVTGATGTTELKVAVSAIE